MSIKALICDDSSFARKQIQKSLPQSWDFEVSQAKNGVECIEALKAGKGEILFLDLNMPEMDGYQVLEAIQAQNIQVIVIVVSGDIQPEAQKRVMMLGALEFIKKPVDVKALEKVLDEKDVYEKLTNGAVLELSDVIRDGFKEIVNVSMGLGVDLLARVLDAFVIMPIPNVNMLEVSELVMTLNQVSESKDVSAICQGFIGSGIAGEALILFSDSSMADIADLMKFKSELTEQVELELLMDISSILCGTCLQGISRQLDIKFSQGHPVVLGRHIKMEDLFKRNGNRWKKMLTIEMPIRIENRNINCDLLLLFTEDSIPRFNELLEYLIE
ncbi:MAG: response regulator [Gammaproteobacteria bacterium]|nr:response regulator [Gammaproteobacteria bacterium]